MLKLRLKRFGKKREPSYRIIAIESRTRRQAQPLAELGFYNPRTKETVLKTTHILSWLRHGAQPTETLEAILRKAGVFDMLAAGQGTDSPDVLRIPAIAKVAAIVDPEAAEADTAVEAPEVEAAENDTTASEITGSSEAEATTVNDTTATEAPVLEDEAASGPEAIATEETTEAEQTTVSTPDEPAAAVVKAEATSTEATSEPEAKAD